jgi:hypothetical protein
MAHKINDRCKDTLFQTKYAKWEMFFLPAPSQRAAFAGLRDYPKQLTENSKKNYYF